MGEVVNIKPVKLEENFEFVQDCCRFQESLLTEANMRLKYGFADSVWKDLGDNQKLLEAVEAEKIRRIRNGSSKREKAQLLVVKAPDVVAKIMMDDSANARHRIDAAASLDKLAANPQDNTPAAIDRFSIVINLGADVDGKPIIERFDKSRTIDVAPNGTEAAPSMPLPDKPWGDDAVDERPVVKTIDNNGTSV